MKDGYDNYDCMVSRIDYGIRMTGFVSFVVVFFIGLCRGEGTYLSYEGWIDDELSFAEYHMYGYIALRTFFLVLRLWIGNGRIDDSCS